MSRPFVSVLIDTYNHERFIEQAVHSVLVQNFPSSEREILVVDDGSQDKTPELLRQFEPRIRILRKANGGQASTFNAGIRECRGEVIAFLDGDDWWAPSKLAAVASAFASNSEVGLLGHGIVNVLDDGRQISESLRAGRRFRADTPEGARLFRVRKSFLGTSRMAARASVLGKIGAVPESLRIQADEYIFTVAAILSEVLILPDLLTFYRIHDANAFMVRAHDLVGLRRKYQILDAVTAELRKSLKQLALNIEVQRLIVEAVQNEADLIRLKVDGGLPWETFRAETTAYRVRHPAASPADRLFHALTFLPACLFPPRTYYSIRAAVAGSAWYANFRARRPGKPSLAHIEEQPLDKS